MSVVQRCPNCGTTKATTGECEACHEAHVRYFCTNHAPGIWLDASACPKCGARFGEPARRTSAPAPAIPATTRAPAPARSRARASTSEPPAPYVPSRPPEARARGLGSGERWPRGSDDELVARPSPMAFLQKLLVAAARARSMAPRGSADGSMLPIARRAGGCLMRLVLLVVFLFAALAIAVFVFGRALIGL